MTRSIGGIRRVMVRYHDFQNTAVADEEDLVVTGTDLDDGARITFSTPDVAGAMACVLADGIWVTEVERGQVVRDWSEVPDTEDDD
jgi:hypothetical protein